MSNLKVYDPLKGMDHKKNIYIIYLREKHFKQKIIMISCQQNVCFIYYYINIVTSACSRNINVVTCSIAYDAKAIKSVFWKQRVL